MKLKHDNDPLAENEKILTNVEAVLPQHPDKFLGLRALLAFIYSGDAKCMCQFPIRREDLRYYRDHEGGIAIPGEKNLAWLYSHCPKCGYDYSFVKILRQMDYHWRQ
jgi:hypothetical protein